MPYDTLYSFTSYDMIRSTNYAYLEENVNIYNLNYPPIRSRGLARARSIYFSFFGNTHILNHWTYDVYRKNINNIMTSSSNTYGEALSSSDHIWSRSLIELPSKNMLLGYNAIDTTINGNISGELRQMSIMRFNPKFLIANSGGYLLKDLYKSNTFFTINEIGTLAPAPFNDYSTLETKPIYGIRPYGLLSKNNITLGVTDWSKFEIEPGW